MLQTFVVLSATRCLAEVETFADELRKQASRIGLVFDRAGWLHARDGGTATFASYLHWAVSQADLCIVLTGVEAEGDDWTRFQIEEALEHDKQLVALTLREPGEPDDAEVRNPLSEFDLDGEVPHRVWDVTRDPRELLAWLQAAPRAHDLLFDSASSD